MQEPDNQELLERIRRVGDVQAYGRLVERHQRRVYAVAYALLGDWSEAQDVTQEVFIRAYVSLPQLRHLDRFGPWLRRITVATCADWRRKGWPWPVMGPGVTEEREASGRPGPAGRTTAPDPADRASLSEEMDAVLRIIGHLPARQRLPLVLHLVDELSPQEVAEILHVPRGTVRSLLHRGKAAVLFELEQHKTEKPVMTENERPEQELPADFVYRILAARSIKVVELALQEAFRRDHAYLGTEHVLIGLAEEGQGAAAQVLRERGVTPDRVRQEIDILLKCGPNAEHNATGAAPTLKDVAGTLSKALPAGAVHAYEAMLPEFLPAGAVRACEAALASARQHGQTRLTPEHMLSAMTQVDCLAATILQRLGVEPREVSTAMEKALLD